MDMALVLLLILVITEIGFAAFECTDPEMKKSWTLKRLAVNAGEIVIFLLMLLLPGIDLSFRFKGLVILLLVRILVSAVFWLANRKNEKRKKRAAIVWGAILSILLITGGMFPAFLIADYHGRAVTGEYMPAECEAILIDTDREESFEHDGSYREVPMHFYYPENAADLPEHSLPLVIFSHGAFGYYQSNASTFLELASHGYAVISLDHPYHSFFTKDSDGKTITVDMGFFQSAMKIGGNDDMPEAEAYDMTSKWMALRESDMNVVIDQVKAAGEAGEVPDTWHCDGNAADRVLSVLNAIDYNKIGLMGHSLGGATAVTVGRRDDISAAVDLDGTMLGEETGVKDGVIRTNELPYDKPLLSIDSESHHQSMVEAEEAGYVYVNNVILDNAVNGYETYFKGAAHMNFTDLPLFSPPLAKLLGTGDVDAGECIDQVNSLVLGFFDSFLKDAGEFSVKESY